MVEDFNELSAIVSSPAGRLCLKQFVKKYSSVETEARTARNIDVSDVHQGPVAIPSLIFSKTNYGYVCT